MRKRLDWPFIQKFVAFSWGLRAKAVATGSSGYFLTINDAKGSHGQTIGKKLMRIRVRHKQAKPASKGSIISRELLGKLVINYFPLVPLISLFTILLTKEHKALHDMLAGTIVSDV